MGNLFAAHRSTIITLYNGAFDSSAAVFFIIKVRMLCSVRTAQSCCHKADGSFVLLDSVRMRNLSTHVLPFHVLLQRHPPAEDLVPDAPLPHSLRSPGALQLRVRPEQVSQEAAASWLHVCFSLCTGWSVTRPTRTTWSSLRSSRREPPQNRRTMCPRTQIQVE